MGQSNVFGNREHSAELRDEQTCHIIGSFPLPKDGVAIVTSYFLISLKCAQRPLLFRMSIFCPQLTNCRKVPSGFLRLPEGTFGEGLDEDVHLSPGPAVSAGDARPQHRHDSRERDGQSSPVLCRMGRSSVSPTMMVPGGGEEEQR